MYKVTLVQQIDGADRIGDTIYLYRTCTLPFLPMPGLTIHTEDWDFEIYSIAWDLGKEVLSAYGKPDQARYNALRYSADPNQIPPRIEFIGRYLEMGWSTKEKLQG